jgi:hypothetical protein
MDLEIGRNRGINPFQEIQELNRTMASIAPAEDIAGGDIESSKQACDAMSFVVMGASLQLPDTHGQHRLGAAQSLNL